MKDSKENSKVLKKLERNSLVLTVVKWLAIFLLVSAGFFGAIELKAGSEYGISEVSNKSGRLYVYVVNYTGRQIYCTIESENYFYDFSIIAYGTSSYYPKPPENYTVRCD